ncbi:MAG: M20 family metallopeptidase [Brevibacterium sp.]|uniref:M20 metallopeptidase family protein n=1 Tax=Brevibacterium sandarakinum TaxID=629680 RepID=UPI002650BE73|nr:M20 family metallopeptidase [Brevibacterium sandarakinum]MDN5585411.1 M20 family metallopeptidase [Brevibacterium sp.]MDN5655962.1 M20 family metallopeptidase [Brevibacterium sandarakinum]
MSALLAEAADLLPQLQDLRRRLHSRPEVGLDLPHTQSEVLTALEGLDLEVSTGVGTTSVVAVLRGTHPDRSADAPSVLLRGDMDALPIEELTDEPFKSTNGNMHSCGHDLHTAGLVGAAKLLHAHRELLAGDVVFMFQPGEEGCNGASVMIDEGVLDAAGSRAIAAFGAHVHMGPRGVVTTKPGTLQAGSNVLRITLHGRGGHGSQPQSAIDPVPALAEVVTALQNMVSRRINAFDPIALSVTQLKAGEAVNVIPASASLGATVRTLSQESSDIVRTQSKQLARGIAEAHGCTAEVDFEVQYPVTVNDETETAWTLDQVRGLLGADRVEVADQPIMPSEDFSFVLQEVPGTYMMLGAKRTDVPEDEQGDNHSPFVIFDDTVLGDQAALLAHLALERLRAEL